MSIFMFPSPVIRTSGCFAREGVLDRDFDIELNPDEIDFGEEGGYWRGSWSQFVAANAGQDEDADLEWFDQVRRALLRGEVFEGGGGAAARFTIRKAA